MRLILGARVDRPALQRLVDAFYVEARQDALLGPVFERHITNWDEHLGRMTDFWASLLIRDRSYSGRPLELHRAIPDLTEEMFDRWVEIFSSAVRGEFGDSSTSEVLIDLAKRMGVQLSKGAIEAAQ
ncbi:MAG TPA: group III truncated hemoglobin [Fimbriimonas sp.]|nr:group III truncated hemoglobin [Fimbriimonas sp.]